MMRTIKLCEVDKILAEHPHSSVSITGRFQPDFQITATTLTEAISRVRTLTFGSSYQPEDLVVLAVKDKENRIVCLVEDPTSGGVMSEISVRPTVWTKIWLTKERVWLRLKMWKARRITRNLRNIAKEK